MSEFYKDKWFAYLKERFGVGVKNISPANNPDPHCRTCWDKGYASQMVSYQHSPDKLEKKWCNCPRGRRMEVEDAYRRGLVDGSKPGYGLKVDV